MNRDSYNFVRCSEPLQPDLECLHVGVLCAGPLIRQMLALDGTSTTRGTLHAVMQEFSTVSLWEMKRHNWVW